MQERNAIDEYYYFKRKYFDPIPESVEQPKPKTKNLVFSKTEKKIISLYIKYYTDEAIAREYNITKNAIQVQLHNIRKKVSKLIKIDKNIKREYQVIKYLKKAKL